MIERTAGSGLLVLVLVVAWIPASAETIAGRVSAQITSGVQAASIASNYGTSDSSSYQTSYNYSL